MGNVLLNRIWPEIFSLVDLRDFFSDLGSGDEKKKRKIALKMTSQLVIFRAFF